MTKPPPWPKMEQPIRISYPTHLPAWLRRRPKPVPTFEIGRASGRNVIVLARYWLN